MERRWDVEDVRELINLGIISRLDNTGRKARAVQDMSPDLDL